MVAICDALIFLSLTFLAVIAAIFVLAVSFLGRAIEQSSEAETRLAEEQAEELDKTIQEAQMKLTKAKASGEVDEAKKELEGYEGKKKAFQKRRAKALAGYRLLTAREGILYPGAVLLLSLAFAAAAKFLTTLTGQYALGFSYALLILAAAGVGWVCYRAYRSLMVVEGVATIPEEVQLKRTVQAFEVALERHEQKKRPELALRFVEPQPPLKFRPSTQHEIRFDVYLKQGDVARVTELWFAAPREFDFPERETHCRPLTAAEFPNTLATKLELDDLKRGILYHRSLTTKVPSEPDTYILGYCFNCEGYAGKFVTFEVEVAE